jgi:hypothetical protein
MQTFLGLGAVGVAVTLVVTVWSTKMNASSANLMLVIAWMLFVISIYSSVPWISHHQIVPRVLWTMIPAAVIGLVLHSYLWTSPPTVTYRDAGGHPIDPPIDVKVEQHDVIDSQRAFLKVRVSKDYLNSSFVSRRTLAYGNRRYQPLLLTFQSDPQKGPGVLVSSPDEGRNTHVFLDEQIRFRGFGTRTFTSDMLFNLYIWDQCVYFMPTVSVAFESGPKFNLGPNNVHMAYFQGPVSDLGPLCSKQVEHVKEFFRGREILP